MYRKLIALSFVFLTLCSLAHATPITYTVSDTASGTIGTQSFSNQTISVVFTGNTSNAMNSNGFVTNSVGSGYITIGSLGTFTFTDPTYFFDNQSLAAAGISDANFSGSILDVYNPAFAAYNGTSNIGPLSGAVFYSSSYTFNTTGGVLNLSNAGAISTFQSGTPGTSVTPEPSSFILLATGLAGMTGAIRRRRAVTRSGL